MPLPVAILLLGILTGASSGALTYKDGAIHTDLHKLKYGQAVYNVNK